MAHTVYALMVEGASEPFYVGCTSRTPSRRLIEHESRALLGAENSGRADALLQAVADGEIIVAKVLEKGLTEEAAYIAEKRWISEYGRLDLGLGPLLNQTDGGRGAAGVILTDSARQKMRDAKIGNTINAGRARADTSMLFSQEVSAYLADGSWHGTYPSARKAGSATGVHFGTISDACKGRIKSCRNKQGEVFQFRKGNSTQPIQPVIYKGHAT